MLLYIVSLLYPVLEIE